VGRHSLYIYLLHFLPVAGTRIVLQKVGFDQVALILPAAVVAGVVFPVLVHYLTARGPPAFLFSVPWLSGRKRITRLRQSASAAE